MLTSNEIMRIKEFKYPPLLIEEISKVEKALKIKFGEDFYEIANICDYEYLLAAGYEFYNMDGNGVYSVIRETLKLRRSCGLPLNYIVLAIQDDVTVILLESAQQEHNKIILCTIHDMLKLGAQQSMEETPLIFPTFTDFFSYLLDEEERRRAEEEAI